MLTYEKQYDVANGIFITYDSQLDYRLLHSKHKKGTRDKMKTMFPYQKWESRTKETFVLSCLYIMFHKTPSSFRSFVNELREVDLKEVSKFKHKILNYMDYISRDVKNLKEKYGGSISHQEILKEYVDGNIEFFTAYWFVKLSNKDWKPGRTFAHIMRKLNFIMLFLTFKDEAVNKIRELFEEIDL